MAKAVTVLTVARRRCGKWRLDAQLSRTRLPHDFAGKVFEDGICDRDDIIAPDERWRCDVANAASPSTYEVRSRELGDVL
jgi:hypothetical protein